MAMVAINSSTASNIVSEIESSCNSLEELSSSIEECLSVLVELGLVSNCASKLKAQISQIIDGTKKISSSISTHISSMAEKESSLNNSFSSGFSSAISSVSSSVQDNDSKFTKDEFDIQEVKQGKKIDASTFEKILKSFDVAKNAKLLKLLNLNKGSDSIHSLLLDESKSKVLYTHLKNIFKDAFSFAELSMDDIKGIQKALLNELFKSKGSYPELNGSLFDYKDYLSMIADENKVDPADLILDNKNNKLLKDSLKKLYSGNVSNGVKDSDIQKFRTSVDSLAKSNGITAEELIDNKLSLLL